MTPLKTSVLTFLILGVFCQCITAFYPARLKECCHSYKTGSPIQIPRIMNYFRTPSDCSLEAVVFVMSNGKKVCANPRNKWVKRTVTVLEGKKIRNRL
uniref:C-C motif chemokine 17 n=1 Tax=Euleptes europaea TaxID=460621 RepID=UPI0025425DBA|nr:C-C motif chemokine 17 [Euleptes europaea]